MAFITGIKGVEPTFTTYNDNFLITSVFKINLLSGADLMPSHNIQHIDYLGLIAGMCKELDIAKFIAFRELIS